MIAFAKEIAEAVRGSIQHIRDGYRLGSDVSGRRWSCCLDGEERAVSEGEPSTGLGVRWCSPWSGLLLPDEVPALFREEVQRLLASTVEKFRGYPNARGILLLDPHGSIRYTGDRWLSRVLQVASVPCAIGEVWLAIHDWVPDQDQGWTFERLNPAQVGSS